MNEILKSLDIEYWVCHGTLLGLVRDNMILPWDTDIDFAVWKDQVSQEKIVAEFKKHGLKQEFVFGEMDCLHFESESKKIDISFYERKNGQASVKWIAPSESAYSRVILFVSNILCNENRDTSNDNKLLRYFPIKILLILREILSENTKSYLYKLSKNHFRYTGYSYPEKLMNFKSVTFLESLVPIPSNPEECLEITYGKDWRTPKKSFVWYNEACNLVSLNKK